MGDLDPLELPASGEGRAGHIQVGNLALDLRRYACFVDGRELHLSPHQFRLLVALAEQPDEVVTHSELIMSLLRVVQLSLLAAIGAFILFFILPLCASNDERWQATTVRGDAMAPTLEDGQRIQVRATSIPDSRLAIVLYRFPPEPSQIAVGRVIGLPGEDVQIRQSTVLVNGKAISEPYVESRWSGPDLLVSLDHQEYFIMGDNRVDSHDSRYWGPAEEDAIIGVVQE